MSEFIAWEFSADSTDKSTESGTATFRVGSDTAMARFDSYVAAHQVSKLMNKAYRSGRNDGMAEIKRVVEFYR